ncbi:sensor histidine kinase [Pseudomonas sp. MWU13-2105]|uniref:sensor histidine kinase n=1 Tax=Pseudomonas sp. MWU13-2105 TaxID=2935074 RepID=UPI00200DA633|nr:ATP-binding protein [Pseudomonas sp. MWU13-2105]
MTRFGAGRYRPRDTVARWIALTVLMAMLTALAFNALFVKLAGVWAYPPLSETGLLEKIISISRVLEASESRQRGRLAAVVSEPDILVAWYTDYHDIVLPKIVKTPHGEEAQAIRRALNMSNRRLETYEPADSDGRYGVLIQLTDGTWLEFSTASRSWGLDEGPRRLIVIVLVLLSTAVVTLIATRRLARPLQQFAQGARRFGVDFRAPPVEPVGPHEIRQAILAFNAMQAQLQHFIKDRTQMLAAISHDLRTPLTRMRLRGEFIEDEEQQQRLFRDVDEMQAMINSALEFFRDDARLEEATSFDLAELLQTLVDDYRDLGIEVDFAGPSRWVYFGRPLGLKRVVGNLLDNAIKYGSEPSIVLESDSERLLIRVQDRGPGIAADCLERVFEAFFRLESSRNKSTGGVGLGLSAARAIVLEQGGTLTLSNRAGGGLVALVLLPFQGGL